MNKDHKVSFTCRSYSIMFMCVYVNGYKYNLSISFRKETKNIALGGEKVNEFMIYEKGYKDNYFSISYSDKGTKT